MGDKGMKTGNKSHWKGCKGARSCVNMVERKCESKREKKLIEGECGVSFIFSRHFHCIFIRAILLIGLRPQQFVINLYSSICSSVEKLSVCTRLLPRVYRSVSIEIIERIRVVAWIGMANMHHPKQDNVFQKTSVYSVLSYFVRKKFPLNTSNTCPKWQEWFASLKVLLKSVIIISTWNIIPCHSSPSPSLVSILRILTWTKSGNNNFSCGKSSLQA